MKIWFPAVRAGSGSDVYTLRLAEALRRRGVATVLTWLPRWLELAPALARVRPPPGTSLIHANSWNAFAFSGRGLPVLATVHLCVHAPELAPYKSIGQRLYHHTLVRRYEQRSFASARAVVAVSDATRRGVVDAFHVNPVVIHNWIDTRVFSPASSPAVAAGRPFRLLFAGNRTRRKGWDILAPLMARLGAGFELVVACGLRSDAAARELPPRARSLGVIREEAAMARAYRDCDAVIMPSRLEGFGYVAVEAMACGKPVIAFDNSSLPEIVADGKTGFLLRTDDVEGLAGACRRLAADRDLLGAMGRAARSAALEKFSEDAALTRYLDLYARLAA